MVQSLSNQWRKGWWVFERLRFWTFYRDRIEGKCLLTIGEKKQEYYRMQLRKGREATSGVYKWRDEDCCQFRSTKYSVWVQRFLRTGRLWGTAKRGLLQSWAGKLHLYKATQISLHCMLKTWALLQWHTDFQHNIPTAEMGNTLYLLFSQHLSIKTTKQQ